MQVRYLLAITLVCSTFLLPTVLSDNFLAFSAQVNQVETITVGSTVTTSQSQVQLLINRSFKVLSTTGTNHPCETYNFTFTGNQGQYVSGNFTSIIPLYFYIVQDTTYQNWLKSGSCGNGADAVVSQSNTMSYSFNVPLPNAGTWDIVLVNYSNSRDASGFIVAYLSSGSYTVTKPLLSTITSTTTSSSSFTQTYPGISGFSVESIALGILVGVAALLVLRRRRSRSLSP